MKFQKSTAQPKDPWIATRALRSTTLQVHGQNSKNNPTGEANPNITTNMGGTEGTSDQETSC